VSYNKFSKSNISKIGVGDYSEMAEVDSHNGMGGMNAIPMANVKYYRRTISTRLWYEFVKAESHYRLRNL
jgi:hypothetical protein